MQKRKTRGRQSITYQNKDVDSKIFGIYYSAIGLPYKRGKTGMYLEML